MTQVDIAESGVTILIEVDGQVCLVKMDKDEYDAVSFLAKQSARELIKTKITQDKLNRFLMPRWFD